MILKQMPGRGQYPPVSLGGSILSVAGQNVDLDQVRGDSEQIVDLYSGPAYLANVIIPPNSYEMVDTGQTDEQGNVMYDKQLQPLDTNRLKVVTWPQPVQPESSEEV